MVCERYTNFYYKLKKKRSGFDIQNALIKFYMVTLIKHKLITSDPAAIRGVQAVRQGGDAKIYDLSGRRLSSPGQGVYIQDGQKRLAK